MESLRRDAKLGCCLWSVEYDQRQERGQRAGEYRGAGIDCFDFRIGSGAIDDGGERISAADDAGRRLHGNHWSGCFRYIFRADLLRQPHADQHPTSVLSNLRGPDLTVNLGGQNVGETIFVMQSTAPGIFLLNGTQAAALNQDGTVNGPTQPALAGSVIQVYATGLGAVDNPVVEGAAAPASPLSQTIATVQASIGGQAAQVQFAGLAPGFAGLYQVNVVVPQLASGAYALQIAAGGVASNAATVNIQ